MQLANNRSVYIGLSRVFHVFDFQPDVPIAEHFSYLQSGGTDSMKHQGSTQHSAGSLPCKWL